MKSAQAQESFSTKDTDSATRKMESMKLNSPIGKEEKEAPFFESIHCM